MVISAAREIDELTRGQVERRLDDFRIKYERLADEAYSKGDESSFLAFTHSAKAYDNALSLVDRMVE